MIFGWWVRRRERASQPNEGGIADASNEAVIVNENIDPREPGDVSLFRSPQRAAAYLEAIDVEDGVYAG